MHALARGGGRLHHRCVAEEGQLLADRGEHRVAILGGDEFPLVEHDQRRTTGRRDSLGQALVLTGRSDRRVDDEHRDVGAVERVEAAQHRVGLESRLGLGATSHARGVDEADQSRRRSRRRVSMASRVVPGMSCTTERSSPMSWLKSVDLPDVGASDDRDAQRPVVVGVGHFFDRPSLAESSHDHVEQVAGAATVQGADACGSPAPKLRNSQLLASCMRVVDLVDDEQDGSAAAQRPARGVGVLVHQPVVTSTTSSTRSALASAASACSRDLVLEGVAGLEPATGVDDVEGDAAPLDFDGLAVARDAAMLLDDGDALGGESIDQRTLARRWVVRR